MRIVRIFAVFTLVFIMTSCARVIENTPDEIRLNKWTAALNGGGKVTLDFSGDSADFIIRNKNNKQDLNISGTAFMDKKRLIVFDKSDSGNYVFTYSLKDDILTLEYDGGKIKLKRVKNTAS